MEIENAAIGLNIKYENVCKFRFDDHDQSRHYVDSCKASMVQYSTRYSNLNVGNLLS